MEHGTKVVELPTQSERVTRGGKANSAGARTSTLAQMSITSIWNELGGGPIKSGRARAFWRNADGWNISLCEEKGAWFDYARGEGGGVFRLVEVVIGTDRRGATEWLERHGFLPRLDRHEKQVRQARSLAASVSAAEIESWRRAVAEELNDAKLAATEAGDWDALGEAAALLYKLECCDAATVVAEFRAAQKKDSADTNRLIRLGREDLQHAEALAKALVDGLMTAKRRKGLHVCN